MKIQKRENIVQHVIRHMCVYLTTCFRNQLDYWKITVRSISFSNDSLRFIICFCIVLKMKKKFNLKKLITDKCFLFFLRFFLLPFSSVLQTRRNIVRCLSNVATCYYKDKDKHGKTIDPYFAWKEVLKNCDQAIWVHDGGKVNDGKEKKSFQSF